MEEEDVEEEDVVVGSGVVVVVVQISAQTVSFDFSIVDRILVCIKFSINPIFVV